MYSPIARGLRAASRLVEWVRRRIHGQEDVVETAQPRNVWVVKRMNYGKVWRLEISCVVRNAGGE